MSTRMARFTLGLSLAGTILLCSQVRGQGTNLVFIPSGGTLGYQSSGNTLTLSGDLTGNDGNSTFEELIFSVSSSNTLSADFFGPFYSNIFDSGSFMLFDGPGSGILASGSLTSPATLSGNDFNYTNFLVGGAFVDGSGNQFGFDFTLTTDSTIIDNTSTVFQAGGILMDGNPCQCDPPPAAAPVSGAQTVLIGLLGLGGAALLKARRKDAVP